MLYQLTGGIILYSETEVPKDKHIEFDAHKTVLLAGQAQRNGQVNMQIQRADKTPWKMTKIIVPWSAVLMYHEVGDAALIASIKGELAGIVMPEGPRLVH